MMFMLMVIMNEAIHSPKEQSVQGKQMVGHNCYLEITSSFQIVIINSAVSMIQVTATITTAKSTICFASITITTVAAAVTAILITIISTG